MTPGHCGQRRRRSSPGKQLPRRRSLGARRTSAFRVSRAGLGRGLAVEHERGTGNLPGRSERRFRVRSGLATVRGGTGLPASCVPVVLVPLCALFWPKSIYTAHANYPGIGFALQHVDFGGRYGAAALRNHGEESSNAQRERKGERGMACSLPPREAMAACRSRGSAVPR